MNDETWRRRPGFQKETWVRLADGQNWSLPPIPVQGTDTEFDALIQALIESEDQNEIHRCELATTILLLARNYELSPREFEEILDFNSNGEALATARRVVHSLLFDGIRGKKPEGLGLNPESSAITDTAGALLDGGYPIRD
jgi:hypothetical protein